MEIWINKVRQSYKPTLHPGKKEEKEDEEDEKEKNSNS